MGQTNCCSCTAGMNCRRQGSTSSVTQAPDVDALPLHPSSVLHTLTTNLYVVMQTKSRFAGGAGSGETRISLTLSTPR